jgi:hypothetical protein
LSVTEEMQLWDMGIPGNTNPSSLNFAEFFVCSQHFGTQGCQEHHQLCVENLKFVKKCRWYWRIDEAKQMNCQNVHLRSLLSSGPLYLTPLKRFQPDDKTWFSCQSVLVGLIMKEIAKKLAQDWM